MLHAELMDTMTMRRVVAASVHLKAKVGAENDAIRAHQVCRHTGFAK
jgi:hypothetical protein